MARPITSLKAAGRIERIACGRMMRRTWRPRGRPSAAAASYWPWSTERMPPRITSAENAAWFSVRPSAAAMNGRDEPGGGRIEQHMPGEGHADLHRLVQIAEVVQQEQQHDQRNRAEQPDVAPGQRAQQRRDRQPRQRDRQRQREAGRAAHQGQHQGLGEPVEHRRREEPLREHAPFPARIAEHRVEHQREQRDRQHAAGDARPGAGSARCAGAGSRRARPPRRGCPRRAGGPRCSGSCRS